jgi:hypothetical protein
VYITTGDLEFSHHFQGESLVLSRPSRSRLARTGKRTSWASIHREPGQDGSHHILFARLRFSPSPLPDCRIRYPNTTSVPGKMRSRGASRRTPHGVCTPNSYGLGFRLDPKWIARWRGFTAHAIESPRWAPAPVKLLLPRRQSREGNCNPLGITPSAIRLV